MPSLFVQCKACHEEFPSGIAVSGPEALKGVTMNSLSHRCPNCGAVKEYFTTDYHVPAGIEKVQERPPDMATPATAAKQEESMRLSGYGVGAG